MLRSLDFSVLQQCLHCGLCLPVCPTYAETGLERHGPRGRIALLRAVALDELPMSATIAREMEYCLGCLACTSACPAGVRYAEIFEAARAETLRTGVLDTRFRRFLRAITLRGLFLRPRALRALGVAMRLYQRSGLETALRRSGAFRLLSPRWRRLETMAPRVSPRFSHRLIAPREAPAAEPPRRRVALLTGCVQDLIYAEVNRDTADVLLAHGCEVVTPPVQPCCGSMHAHNGDLEAARTLARRMIDLIPPGSFDAVISNAGGCGSHLRHYDRLLADDPAYADRARAFAAKVRDVHEWLVGTGLRAPPAGADAPPLRVAYHESCHLRHGQGVARAPRQVLAAIPGVTLVDLPEAEWCCGSAGVYSLTQPETADRLLDRKVANVLAAGADVVALGNPGCQLQIETGLRRAGATRIRVAHTVTLFAEALRRA
ncbi:MAG: (Fe-S)-binding protein [Lentisphaerae bacterium]|nr:(Fe-S)-binding protein [Lentisphaerota bacterium]